MMNNISTLVGNVDDFMSTLFSYITKHLLEKSRNDK